jgi:hypothetical protein
MFFMAQVSSISIQDEALAAMHDIVGHLIKIDPSTRTIIY